MHVLRNLLLLQLDDFMEAHVVALTCLWWHKDAAGAAGAAVCQFCFSTVCTYPADIVANMATPRQLLRSQITNLSRNQRLYSSSRKVQGMSAMYRDVWARCSDTKHTEHDVLFLRQQGKKYPKWHVTPPLRHDGKIKLAYGASIASSDIIGRHILDQVSDSKGNRISIQEVSLASYITNSERLATPVRIYE